MLVNGGAKSQALCLFLRSVEQFIAKSPSNPHLLVRHVKIYFYLCQNNFREDVNSYYENREVSFFRHIYGYAFDGFCRIHGICHIYRK